jgi:putative ABC transport system substrate-binding protein
MAVTKWLKPSIYRIPAIYVIVSPLRRGRGVMSYGGSLTDAYRLVGLYIGRILRGPAELSVQQATKTPARR